MQRHAKILKITYLAVLLAIIILMSFTPIGYIKIPGLGLEITLLSIPVAIGAIMFGPYVGLLLGFCFGFSSFLQCLLGLSPFGATLLTINPIFTCITCIVPRVLMGYLVGVIYKGINLKFKNNVIPMIIANLLSAVFNTVFFMTALCLFFYRTDFIQSFVNSLNAHNPIIFIILFVGINGIVEILINSIIGTAITKVLYQINVFKTNDEKKS